MNGRALHVSLFFLIIVGPSVIRAERTAPRLQATVSDTVGVVPQHAARAQSAPSTAASGPVAEAKNEIVEHLKSGMILDYATFHVAVVTAIFTFLLAVLGSLEWYRFRKLRKDLTAMATKVTAQGRELKKERQSLDKRIETFKAAIQAQETQLTASQRFLEAVLSHHSALLVGIVEGFGTVLKPQDARKLTSLIFEAEAALDLFYPDNSEVLKALRRLEEVGSDGSVSSLAQLRDDKTADPEIRLRAQSVLTKIKERLKKVTPSTPTQTQTPKAVQP